MATAFAVFCATDGSLTFYNRDSVPSVGDIFEGKAVSNVYTGLENTNYITDSNCPWHNIRKNILKVSFVDIVAPSDIDNWFSGLSNVTSIDLKKFDTKNLTSLYCAFAACKSLTEFNFSGNYDTSNLTNMSYMFQNCYALTTVNFSGFDTSTVTNMDSMFKDCSALEKIYISEHWSVDSVTSSAEMFYNCTSLVGAVPFDSNKTNVSMANYETGYFTYKRYVKPEDMLIKNTTLYDMADKIRILSSYEETMTPAVMEEKLDIVINKMDDALFLKSEVTETIAKMPSSQDWQSIAYGNGKFVAITNSSISAYSEDGLNWIESTLPFSTGCQSIAYGNNKFVVSTYNRNGIAYSEDGINWSTSSIGSNENWNITSQNWIVGFGNDKFVALNSNASNAVAYSYDGISWTPSILPVSKNWKSIAYGNGKFVAVQDGGVAIYSEDGITWHDITIKENMMMSSVTFGNGKFVAVASSYLSTNLQVAYSEDGITWHQSEMPGSATWKCVTYGNGKFVAIEKTTISSNKAAYSEDGIVWYETSLPGDNIRWSNLLYGNNKFISVPYQSDIVAISFDGINWSTSLIESSTDIVNNSGADVTDETIDAVVGDEIDTQTDLINQILALCNEIMPPPPPIYGVEWDGSASTAWTRTDSSVMLAEPVPAVAGGTGSSPFDNIYPWSGMVRVTDPEAGEVVAIPKFYFKWSVPASGTGLKLQISEKPFDGSHVSPAHAERGDGKGERDIVYVGRYHSSINDYKSVSGVMPKVSITRATARTDIAALGDSVWQWDMAMHSTIEMLYLVEFADWNSQAKIGYGCGNGSELTGVGYTDSMQYHTGTMCATREEYGYGTQYRYIEGLWDNVWDWLDGVYNNTNGFNVIMNPNEYSDTTGGTTIGIPESGYPSAWTISDVSNMEWVIYSSTVSDSSTTYTTDNRKFVSSRPAWFVGGNLNQNQDYGLFYTNCQITSFVGSGSGCRLQILP